MWGPSVICDCLWEKNRVLTRRTEAGSPIER